MLFANPGSTPRTDLDSAPDAVWIDLINPGADERAAAERVAGFPLPTRENIAEIESSSRVSTKDGVLFLNTPVSYRDSEGRSTVAPVGFALSQQRLVTIRFADMPVFDRFAERFAQAPCATSAEAFAGVIEALVDRAADVMEHLAAELDELSRKTFQGEEPSGRRIPRRADIGLRRTLKMVGQYGDAIANLRDTLLGLTRIVGYANLTGAAWIPPGIRERLVTVRQDIASLTDYDQQLTVKTSFLLDAVLGFINIEQNNSVKVLTVVSVVGIPPTFVVGLYGMNFKTMPEYDWAWGYAWGWAMILVSIILPLVFIRIKGWL